MNCVSTGSYILVYSYLDLRASRLKVTKTESTLLGMLFNVSQSFDINIVCAKTLCNIKIDRNKLRGNGDLTVSSRTISIAVF